MKTLCRKRLTASASVWPLVQAKKARHGAAGGACLQRASWQRPCCMPSRHASSTHGELICWQRICERVGGIAGRPEASAAISGFCSRHEHTMEGGAPSSTLVALLAAVEEAPPLTAWSAAVLGSLLLRSPPVPVLAPVLCLVLLPSLARLALTATLPGWQSPTGSSTMGDALWCASCVASSDAVAAESELWLGVLAAVLRCRQLADCCTPWLSRIEVTSLRLAAWLSTGSWSNALMRALRPAANAVAVAVPVSASATSGAALNLASSNGVAVFGAAPGESALLGSALLPLCTELAVLLLPRLIARSRPLCVSLMSDSDADSPGATGLPAL